MLCRNLRKSIDEVTIAEGFQKEAVRIAFPVVAKFSERRLSPTGMALLHCTGQTRGYVPREMPLTSPAHRVAFR